MTSWVMALRAPRTLTRCRPLGALIQHRANHHRYPSTAPKTKWAASTKNTARSPACASAKRGSNFFLIRLLRLGVGFGRQQPHLKALQTEMLEKQTDLGRTAAEAGQGFEYGDGFIDCLGRLFSQMGFNRVPMRLQCALGAMKRQLFQRLYTPGLIPFQVSA